MRVETGKKMKPLAILAHGERGTGKTNLPIEAYKPIWLGNEETDEYDVARLPKIEFWEIKDLKSPNAEAGLINQLKWLLTAEHDYKTLVIDTLDGLETIAEKEILKTAGGKTMITAFGGFSKAYKRMGLMFQIMRDEYLIPLRDVRGMNIVILCHSEKYKIEDPMTSTSYDRYQTALHKEVKPIFEDWVSAILFVSYKLYKAENQAGKEHATGTGARVIYTEERPSHVAKNRFSLPYEMPYLKNGTWGSLGATIKAYFGSAPKFVAPVREAVPALTVDQMDGASPEPFVPEVSPVSNATAAAVPEPVTHTTTAQTTTPAAEKPAPLAPAASTTPQEFNASEYNDVCKSIDEMWGRVPEANKPSIQTSIQRAGQNIVELKRIASKIETLIK